MCIEPAPVDQHASLVARLHVPKDLAAKPSARVRVRREPPGGSAKAGIHRPAPGPRAAEDVDRLPVHAPVDWAYRARGTGRYRRQVEWAVKALPGPGGSARRLRKRERCQESDAAPGHLPQAAVT